jgi:hypothetical protein
MGFPLKPHLPVQVGFRQGCLEWVPVLSMPQKLPTEVPFGPRKEPRDWTQVAMTVERAHHHIDSYNGPQWENVQVLDATCTEFVKAFEAQLCELLDVPKRQNSGRGRPPIIRWVEGGREQPDNSSRGTLWTGHSSG